MASKNYSKFMSAKLEYNRKDLLKQIPPEYHLIITIFMKLNADVVVISHNEITKSILKRVKKRHLFKIINFSQIKKLLL